MFTGGQIIGWATNATTYVIGCDAQGRVSNIIPASRSEYLGAIPVNQEATEESLIGLEAYWQFVISTSNSGMNCGIQPFGHFLMWGTGGNVITETFDIRGAYCNGQMYVSVDLDDEGDKDDEGDSNPRCLDIYLDGSQIGSCNSVGPYSNGDFNSFSFSLGTLSAGVLTLGIEQTTFNYTTPNDWWVTGAAIDDPPQVGRRGRPICPRERPPAQVFRQKLPSQRL